MKRYLPMVCQVAVFSLLLSVIWPTQAMAATAPSIVSLMRISGAPFGLYAPTAMDIDQNGNLYVVDSDSERVFKFDPYGAQARLPFASGARGTGLAVTPDGSKLYVSMINEVAVFNPNTGVQIGVLDGAGSPEFTLAGAIELDVDGNILVADAASTTMHVKVYDPSGTFVGTASTFGGPGAVAGKFNNINDVTMTPNGKVVVANSVGGPVGFHVFNWDSISQTATSPVFYAFDNATMLGTGTLYTPLGSAFDSQGRGYYLGGLNDEFRVADDAFVYLSRYANKGSGVGQLSGTRAIAYDRIYNRLFVSCAAGARIEVFGIDGGTNPVPSNHAPTVPTNLVPSGGVNVTVLTPTLEFDNSTDEDGDDFHYHVVVKQGGTEIHVEDVARRIGATTTHTLVAGILAENQTYTWSVYATDGVDDSAPSSEATFSTNAIEENPSTPLGLSPVAGETLTGLDALSWLASTDPDPGDTLLTYTVEIATDAGFAAPVASASVNATSLTLGSVTDYLKLVDGTTYFWRVTAADSKGNASAPSVAGQFLYDTTVLTVTANMPGASVYLGGNHGYYGRKVGTAPLELRDLDLGATSLVVARSGFEPVVAQISLAAGENLDFAATLVPAMTPVGMKVRSEGVNGRMGLTVNGAAAPYLVDFDNDGAIDLIAGDAGGQIQLFPAMDVVGDRLYFGPGAGLGLPVLPGAVPFVADWDNDGRKDLIVGLADGTVRLFLNQGLESAPAFGAGSDMMAGGSVLNVGSAVAPAVADMNADGNKDLVVALATGEVAICLNAGSDAAPQLAAPSVVLTVAANAVAFPVDWDADGKLDLLVTANGSVSVYPADFDRLFTLPAVPVLAGSYAAVFPIDVKTGNGKELLAGGINGRMAYIENQSTDYVAAFQAALDEKVDELAESVSDESPGLLADVTSLRGLITAGDFAAAQTAANDLAGLLPGAGAAQQSALELAALLN